MSTFCIQPEGMERISCLLVRCSLIICLFLGVRGEPSYGPASSPDGQLCISAKHPDFCLEFLSKHLAANESFLRAKHGVEELRHSCGVLRAQNKVQSALSDCRVLLEDASDLIGRCLSSGSEYLTAVPSSYAIQDLQTWMSAALTDYTTCMDSLRESGGVEVASQLELAQGRGVEKLISTSLAIIASMYPPAHQSSSDASSEWVTRGRKLADSPSIVPNVTVAQDGSGQFSSVSAAIASAPTKSNTRYVIYIKGGTYVESFEVPKSKPNIMLLGDGIRKTVITGSKSVQDAGVTTFSSATVIVSGSNFLAKGITIQNTAGAAKHQAVALRVSADQAAFFSCSFEGFQDTLYTHSLRQFYSQCRIYGTVDYVFGNAAAVFYKSELVARVPLDKQKNTHTAQGRTDPNQNTGLSFQSCSVDGNADLKRKSGSVETYLGRPWKEYSRTVFLSCYEGDVIHPAGWLPWDGNFALSTLFYGEYLATGPGSGSAQRVPWSTQIQNANIAAQFSSRNFISGQSWLPQTSFPFQLDL